MIIEEPSFAKGYGGQVRTFARPFDGAQDRQLGYLEYAFINSEQVFGGTGFPVYAWLKLPDMKLEKIKIIVEIIALLSIAFYFLYKNAAGWTGMTMSLDITTHRVHDPADKTKDILGVIVKVKNGINNGSIRLSDAVAVIKYDKVTLENRLEGIVRYEIENGKVIHGKQSSEKPWTGLGPNEEILLSTYANVSTGSVCIVDVTILAKKFLNTHCNESRSTAISLPIN